MNNFEFVLYKVIAKNIGANDILNLLVQHSFQQAHDAIVTYQNNIADDNKDRLYLSRQLAEKEVQNLEFILKETKASTDAIYNVNYAYGDVISTVNCSIDTLQDTLDDALDLIQRAMIKA